MTNKQYFSKGAKSAIPIALGYFTVAFSLGIFASNIGMTPVQGFISSILNHASAGEYCEMQCISTTSSYIETAIATLIINSRYLLMSTALSQKFAEKTPVIHRIITGFGITDEIFGVCVSEPGDLSPFVAYGAMTVAIPSWALGTSVGIVAGNILPARIVTALSVALYGMFIAIVVPPAKKNKTILALVLISYAASWGVSALQIFTAEHESIRVIVLTVIISAAAALISPVKEDEYSLKEEETEVTGNER